jgi:pyrroloquinoline-quinone synthase
MAAKTFRDQIREAVESRHSRHHPYYALWAEGKLTRAQMGGWAQEHYHFTKDIPWLIGPMLSDNPYPEVRESFRHAIEEEMDPRDPHIEVLLRFSRACGLDDAQIKRSKPLPTTQALLDWIYILSRHRSMVEAIAGLNIGLESQPPQLYGGIIPALLNVYGFKEEEIHYFPLHTEADMEHGERAYRLVEKYTRSEEMKQRVILAAREGAEKRWLYIDGIHLHHVMGYRLTDERWDEYQAEFGPSPFYRAVS